LVTVLSNGGPAAVSSPAPCTTVGRFSRGDDCEGLAIGNSSKRSAPRRWMKEFMPVG
jgi:hypothetical protein